MVTNATPKVVYAIFSPDESHHHTNLEGMCSGETYTNEWAALVDTKRIPTTYKGKIKLYEPDKNINGTFYAYQTNIHRKYHVILEAWHNVAFQVCPLQGTAMMYAAIGGEITFHNPYGYLPAELYGFLPFEESALMLHHAILFVVLIATVEATTWFAAYHSINKNGEPYCCPFPSQVVAALVLQVFRQTFSRTLLLVVCLGYGVVRPKLMSTEWIAHVYLPLLKSSWCTTCTAMLQRRAVFMYELPSMMMDIIFLSWIYLALTSTI
eukprot:gene12548-26427_t